MHACMLTDSVLSWVWILRLSNANVQSGSRSLSPHSPLSQCVVSYMKLWPCYRLSSLQASLPLGQSILQSGSTNGSTSSPSTYTDIATAMIDHQYPASSHDHICQLISPFFFVTIASFCTSCSSVHVVLYDIVINLQFFFVLFFPPLCFSLSPLEFPVFFFTASIKIPTNCSAALLHSSSIPSSLRPSDHLHCGIPFSPACRVFDQFTRDQLTILLPAGPGGRRQVSARSVTT